MIRPQPLIWEVLYFMKKHLKTFQIMKECIKFQILEMLNLLERKFILTKNYITFKRKNFKKINTTRGYYGVTLF